MRVVEVEIITSEGVNNVAFISRIKFIFDNNGLPFTFARKQFPLQLAFAMTINKSQWQTLFHVGLHFADDLFFAWPTLCCLFMHQSITERQSSIARHCAWPDWPYAQCCVRRSPLLRLHASLKWFHNKLHSRCQLFKT